jgi:hypothetical protein
MGIMCFNPFPMNSMGNKRREEPLNIFVTYYSNARCQAIDEK